MADEDTGNGGAANSGSGDGGGENSAKTFTQAEVDRVAGKARGEAVSKLFKDAGLDNLSVDDLKGLAADAAEHRKGRESAKGDVERLNGEVEKYKPLAEQVPGLNLTILRQQVAGKQQLPPRLWKLIEGDDEDSIKASIEDLKKEFGIETDDGDDGGDKQQQNGRIGSGRRPAPNAQQGSGGGRSEKASLTAGREAYNRAKGIKTE